MESPALARRAVLPALLLVAACSSGSEVVELSPEVFGLTMHASTPAAAARLGVEQARRYCGERERGFDVVRSEIWPNQYRIAFRCPRVMPDALTPLDFDPTAPGYRPPAASGPAAGGTGTSGSTPGFPLGTQLF